MRVRTSHTRAVSGVLRENLPRWNVPALSVARPVRHSTEQLQGHGASTAPRYVPRVPDGRAVPGIRAWKRTRPRPALPRDHPSPRALVTGNAPGAAASHPAPVSAQENGPAVTRHCGPAPPGPASRPSPSHHGRAAAQRRVPRGAPPPAIPAGTGLKAWRKQRQPLPAPSASEPPPFAARRRRPGSAPPPGGHRTANYSSRQPLRSLPLRLPADAGMARS